MAQVLSGATEPLCQFPLNDPLFSTTRILYCLVWIHKNVTISGDHIGERRPLALLLYLQHSQTSLRPAEGHFHLLAIYIVDIL